MVGTMTSYSVYQLSEANTLHLRQNIECESEVFDMLLVDPEGASGEERATRKMSYMTGFSRGFTVINEDEDDPE